MATDVKALIWSTTGNPFVDMGQEMMAALAGVNYPGDLTVEDVQALVPRLVDLYFQEGWNKNSYTIFPNSVLNNGKNRREKYRALLNGWLRATETPEDNGLGATCAISGRPAQTYVSKVYLPMSDSAGGNFQSANEEGTPLSAAVALALQFSPLGLVKVGKMMALPHFSSDKVQAEWADGCAKYVTDSAALGTGGVRDTGTFRAANAFFKLIEKLIKDHRNLPNSSVTLYLFNNFNQVDYKAASELYYMPSKVFGFIQQAMLPEVSGEWQRIVWRGYQYVKDKDKDDDDALQKYNNLVYNNLLAGKSISGFFLNRQERRPVVRGAAGWKLFTAYLQEVQGMDKERLDNLRDLGDKIAPLVRAKRKRLLALERAGRKGKFVEVLYRLTKDAAAAGQPQPLITFDQLISDVLPHDNTAYDDWREVKNLLLFRIYEQLFDDLKNDPDYLSEGDDTEDETEEVTA